MNAIINALTPSDLSERPHRAGRHGRALQNFTCARQSGKPALLVLGSQAFRLRSRLTRRLERLQVGVQSLGAGDLSARVKVEGRDEVAKLANSFNQAAGRI